MYKIKLYLTMITTVSIFIAISTLAIVIISEYIGLGIYFGLIFALLFNLIQWILAPKIIESIYKVRPLHKSETPWIHETIEKISKKTGIKKPKVMIAQTDIPNAFAYGGIFGEKKVAVTSGLLNTLEKDEIEAVLGHELGHIKHHDVTIMMFLSVLPSIFYLFSRITLYQIYFAGIGGDDRDTSPLLLMAIGILSLIIYFILNLFLLGFSRLREYYADYESAVNIENGARKLMDALAKISSYTHEKYQRGRKKETVHTGSFKALLIADPDMHENVSPKLIYRNDNELVDEILHQKVTFTDRLFELFSTHPNLVKRLKRLQMLADE